MAKPKKETKLEFGDTPKWKAAKEAAKEMSRDILKDLKTTREKMAEALFREAPETVSSTWLEYFQRRVRSIENETRLRMKHLTEPAGTPHHDIRPSTKPFSLLERRKHAA